MIKEAGHFSLKVLIDTSILSPILAVLLIFG